MSTVNQVFGKIRGAPLLLAALLMDSRGRMTTVSSWVPNGESTR